MNKRISIVLILFLGVFRIAFSQSQDYLSISGKVNLLAGMELTTPIEAYVIIKSENKFAITDSLGEFRIDSLYTGTYEVSIKGFGYQDNDTIIKISNSIENMDLFIIAECEINKDIAYRDIKKNKPKLLLSSGIAPIIYPEQGKFEEKYQVKYSDYGCVTPPIECIEQYNREIFKYLDNKFGKSWRREVRKDVVGLKKRR